MPLFFALVAVLSAAVVSQAYAGKYLDMLGFVINDYSENPGEESGSVFDPSQQVSVPPAVSGDTSDTNPEGDPNGVYGVDYIWRSDVRYPKRGDRYGEIVFNSQNDYTVRLYFDDTLELLKWGAGQYYGSFPPGFGRTILIGGHNVSRFNSIGELQPGDIITIRTSYSNYQYRVTHSLITDKDDPEAFDLNATVENLVLYNCYPAAIFGITNRRLFVYCEKISGPAVLNDE